MPGESSHAMCANLASWYATKIIQISDEFSNAMFAILAMWYATKIKQMLDEFSYTMCPILARWYATKIIMHSKCWMNSHMFLNVKPGNNQMKLQVSYHIVFLIFNYS